MKVIFERQPLAGGIKLIQNMVQSASTMPILAHILIETGEGETDFTGTDLESFGRVRLKARVEEAGRITVPARLLADIVSVLPEGEVTFESAGARLTISCNRNSYQLTTLPAEEFPEWPRIEPETTLVLRQADLKRALHNTMFAIPQRDPRKVLKGVYLELNEGRLICVATDGRKLGKCEFEPVEIRGGDRLQAIVPDGILREIDRAIGEEGEIELGVSERQIIFTLSNLNYVANRIDGAYPQYSAVIPNSFKRTIKIQKNDLADAINRAGILAERQHHSIVLSFTENNVEIKSHSSDEGAYEGQVEIDYQGDPFKIAFNFQYLQEVFKVTTDSVLDMKIKESTQPVVFESEEDPDSIFLVMPVRIAEFEGENEAAE